MPALLNLFQSIAFPAQAGIHMWTAPDLQGFAAVNGSGRERSYVRPLRAVGLTAGPDGLRGSGPEHSGGVAAPLGPTGCPDPRFDRLPSRSLLPLSARLVSGVLVSDRQGPAVDLAADHHRPQDAGHFVGECDGGELFRL